MTEIEPVMEELEGQPSLLPLKRSIETLPLITQLLS